jgi:hypothetical protein
MTDIKVITVNLYYNITKLRNVHVPSFFGMVPDQRPCLTVSGVPSARSLGTSGVWL